jgi:hypothetical protein
MGQIANPPTAQTLILSATDRLISSNAGSGLNPAAQHVIALGEDAGLNTTGSYNIFLGEDTGANSTASSMTIVGENSGEIGTQMSSANFYDGTVIVGANSANAFNNADNGAGANRYGMVIVGSNVFPSTPGRMADLVAIGNSIGVLWTVGGNTATRRSNVLIGNNVLPTAIGNQSYALDSNVLIGYRCGTNLDLGISGSVYIGASISALTTSGGPTSQTSIGSGIAHVGTTCGEGVAIGAGVSIGAGSVNCDFNTVIGRSASAVGSHNTILGTGAVGPSNSGANGGNRNIVIGYSAGATTPAQLSDMIIVGINTRAAGLNLTNFSGMFFVGNGNLAKTLLWGDLNTGNLMVGNTTTAANRDMITNGFTNGLKILAGAWTAAGNPANGGTFYYDTATGLHFVAHTGTNTLVAPI